MNSVIMMLNSRIREIFEAHLFTVFVHFSSDASGGIYANNANWKILVR